MAITQAMCTSFKTELLKGVHDFTNSTGDTFKIALYTSSASLDATTTAYSATNEVSGTGYTAGGEQLASQATTIDTTDDEGVFDADDVTWSSSTVTARYAVLYDSTHASNLLIAQFDFGSDQESSSGDFTIQWNAEGILNLG